MPYYVYILRCSDGSLYTGCTNDIARRTNEHESGADPDSYTYSRRPVKLVWFSEFSTHDEAFTFERQIKGWRRSKKEALINNDWGEIHNIVATERRMRKKGA